MTAANMWCVVSAPLWAGLAVGLMMDGHGWAAFLLGPCVIGLVIGIID